MYVSNTTPLSDVMSTGECGLVSLTHLGSYMSTTTDPFRKLIVVGDSVLFCQREIKVSLIIYFMKVQNTTQGSCVYNAPATITTCCENILQLDSDSSATAWSQLPSDDITVLVDQFSISCL